MAPDDAAEVSKLNAAMPLHVNAKVADALNDEGRAIKGSKILLLGVAYKPNVHDTRESPSLEVMRQLLQRGAELTYCDPWVPEVELDGVTHTSVDWSADAVAGADCVVMLAAHREFVADPYWRDAKLLVDTRNVSGDGPGVWKI